MTKTGMLLASLLVCSGGLHAETGVDAEEEKANGSAKIYRSVDKNGNVIFSDQPPGDGGASEEVHLRTPNAVPMEQVKLPRVDPQPAEKEQFQGYVSLVITSPEPESTIRNPQEPVPVVADLKPSLQDGDRLVLFDNGEAQAGMELNTVIRGTHSLVVKVVGPDDEVLISSEPVQVYVHRSTVQNFQNRPGNGNGGNRAPNTIGDPARRGNSAGTGESASSGKPAGAGDQAGRGKPARPAQQRPVLTPR
ncbi:DUF4124 domain-containing protein [Alcanivorax jadensis]|uniref:DUF4124 domain-containing protein n=1 Tax=Alcanivorax jadensis TaxID=64988 RepID=UPI0026F18803|nr:DUF4124 domain-containing protein [Alcanivorax jadensis]